VTSMPSPHEPLDMLKNVRCMLSNAQGVPTFAFPWTSAETGSGRGGIHGIAPTGLIGAPRESNLTAWTIDDGSPPSTYVVRT
jgi:hypothetical protein